MSTINVSNLIISLQKKINSATGEKDLLYYAKAIQQLKTGTVYFVNNLSQLPSPTTVLGSLYYVRSDETVYLSSEFGWTEIYKTSTSNIFSWGFNSCGRLGDGTTVTKCSPVREFCSATDWCQVSAGSLHMAALKTSGQLWTWGSGACGRLGNGTTVNKCSPSRVGLQTNWCQVSAGGVHTAAINTSGELFAWGRFGPLGDGIGTTNSCVPRREFCSATDWCGVSAGNIHTAAIKTSGEIWTWGNNGCGFLGDGTTVSSCSPVREFCSATDWCGVSAGNIHTAAIKTSGEIWTWGSNSCGRLGDGTTVSSCSPVREFCSATDWCQVSAGGYHTAALKTSGQLWSWGRNNCGALGDGTTVSSCSPVREICSATDWCQVSAGGVHTAALKTSGQIWGWGCFQGDGTTVASCSPVREFCSATDWCSVSGGSGFTAAILVGSF